MLLFETHFQITLDPKRLKRFEPIPKKLEASLKEKTSLFLPATFDNRIAAAWTQPDILELFP